MQEYGAVSEPERLRNQDKLPSRVSQRDGYPPHPKSLALPQDRPRPPSERQRQMHVQLLLDEARKAGWPALTPPPDSLVLPKLDGGRAAWVDLATWAPIGQLHRLRTLLTNCPALFQASEPEPEFSSLSEIERHFGLLIRESRDPERRRDLQMQRKEAVAAFREHQANAAAIQAGYGPPE
jgi:hypothetical protein